MAQHDLDIANQSAPNFRQDLNNALETLGTLSSGSTAPSTTYANMLWYDTVNNILKMRNEANDTWISLFQLNQSTEKVFSFGSKYLGEPFPVWDYLSQSEVPDNSGTPKFVRLTAGQSGTGGFNDGLLINETVTGSAPLVEAVAEIAIGPMTGEIVPLVNTEGAFVRPGTSSGSLQFDQMQRITGTFDGRRFYAGGPGGAGALTDLGGGVSQDGPDGGSFNAVQRLTFDSAQSPGAKTSSGTNGETRPKNRQATYYMRII